MNKQFVVLVAIIGIIAIAIFLIIMFSNKKFDSQNKDCDLIINNNTRDDCYHALAHETNNKTICNKVSDSEKKEHCFGHIPGQ